MVPVRLGKVVALPHTDTCRTKRTITGENLPIPFMRIRSPSYAYTVDTQDTMQAIACPTNPITPKDPLLVTGDMINSFPNPTRLSACSSMSGVHALTLSPTMEVTSVPCVVMAVTPHATALETDAESVLYKIVTPYNPKGRHLSLKQADLLHLFILSMTSFMAPPLAIFLHLLICTFIPNNLDSAGIDLDYMDSFLVEEVTSGHMDCFER